MKVHHEGKVVVRPNVWCRLFENQVCRWTWTLVGQLTADGNITVAAEDI